MRMQRLPLRITLPVGLALLLLVVLGMSLVNVLDKRLDQLGLQARRIC